MDRWQTKFEIKKADEEQRIAFGLAWVASVDGAPVVDLEDDIVPIEVIEKAAYNFVLNSRNAGELHETKVGIGRLVESVVTGPGKPVQIVVDGKPIEGWWVGFKVDDADVWAKIKSGEYASFSVGGSKTIKRVQGGQREAA